MDLLSEIVEQIEVHSIEGIKKCFEKGLDPNVQFRNRPLIYELISEYSRSPLFSNCVRAFVDHGLVFEDDALLAVLLNDHKLLSQHITKDPGLVSKKYTLPCAYTPLFEAGLLHVCAEFNQVACAEILFNHGADINMPAGKDENGFGGQTPIFHTVNQNTNQSAAMMDFLLSKNVDLKITVTGLIWGKGYPWETFIPAVNPISYAMMGLIPQMHRRETVISSVVIKLLKAAYGIDYTPPNIPNKYLMG